MDSKIRALYELAYNLLLKAHDSVFLNMSLGICLQLRNPNFQTFFNSLSLLVAVCLLAYLHKYFRILRGKISKPRAVRKTQFVIDKYSHLIEEYKFGEIVALLQPAPTGQVDCEVGLLLRKPVQKKSKVLNNIYNY